MIEGIEQEGKKRKILKNDLKFINEKNTDCKHSTSSTYKKQHILLLINVSQKCPKTFLLFHEREMKKRARNQSSFKQHL